MNIELENYRKYITKTISRRRITSQIFYLLGLGS